LKGHQLSVKDIALISSFASLYTILSFWSLFPILGAAGKFITLSSIVAPLIGMILGPYRGVLSVTLAGLILLLIGNLGAFGPLSFVPGASTALFSGLLSRNMKASASVIFIVVVALFAFYPNSGPAWSFPYFLWLHIVAFIVLLSIQLLNRVDLHSSTHRDLMISVASLSFTSTMFGHLVGSLMFEALFNSNFSQEGWGFLWQSISLVYPYERAIITIFSTLLGFPIIKILNSQKVELINFRS